MIPTVDDVRSADLTHRFGDMFNLPGLTNFIGSVQVDFDITGIRSLNFPPFGTSDTITGCLFVDGRFFKSTGTYITYTWYPDRIVRRADYEGLRFTSVTAMALGRMAAMVDLEVENRSGVARTIDLRFGLAGGIAKSLQPWNQPYPPTEESLPAQYDEQRGAFIFTSPTCSASSCQGMSPQPEVRTSKSLSLSMHLEPGAKGRLSFVNAIGDSPDEARALYDALIHRTREEIVAVRTDWNEELRAIFTPGNSRYSGFLPTLETTDRDLLRLYHTGILGVVYFKRDNPYSVIGRAYDTLMPKWWLTVTFMWDYSLSSIVHALLDPAVMRKYLEHWMHLDIHKYFGTEYLTGGGVGPWYSVNDFAMMQLSRDYLRWTGDHQWLSAHPTAGDASSARQVLDFLLTYANNWTGFRQPGGLADYGGLLNLLECVSTYVHQVASLNAGNVFNLRTASDILAMCGHGNESDTMRREAAELVANILPLYKEGEGYWRARFPDGSLVDVRHCYDFFTVLNTIGDDLTPRVKSEMIAFFKREFHSPTWMNALATGDDDVMFSVRPDHQWNGAYPAWPPQAVLALYKCGEAEFALQWLRGLARSANQGPFGQAHFVEHIIAPDEGGARKAPIDFPFITDWTVSSGGSWVSAVIEGLFGVKASLNSGITATPQFASFDPAAELHNLGYQGKRYHVRRAGVVPAE
jgi:hypothetical protein